ncbi:hypothetical protein QCA50_013282 [Cerrena zonata]|uniref:Uncharacterized protein n=1 Tax=Cerrena zonata TaxID=2478898 RepID=A0AAW0FX28_9APHY
MLPVSNAVITDILILLVVVEKTNSGRISFNDTFTLLMVHEIPFGGHGHSGYGSYFDKHTFDVFTHHRGSIDVPAEEEPNLEGRYPPYTEEKYKERGAIMWLPLPDA